METQGIYVDVLLAMNFMVDYLLLVSAQLLCRRRLYRRRMVAAALLGAGSSLSIFLPRMNGLAQWLGKLLISALMSRMAEPWQGWKRFFCGWLTLFGVTFLYGGAMLALRMSVGEGWMLWANGVAYFDITPLTLVLNIGLGFGIVRLFQRLFPDKNPQELLYDVELTVQGTVICGKGLLDTGNQLTEPFSGWPVILLERRYFPGNIPEHSLRLIPCKTISGEGLLPAVKGDKLRLKGGEEIIVEQFYVALTEQPLGDGRFQLLLSGALLGSK